MNNVTEKKKTKTKKIASKFHHLLTQLLGPTDNLVPLILSQVLLLNIKLIVNEFNIPTTEIITHTHPKGTQENIQFFFFLFFFSFIESERDLFPLEDERRFFFISATQLSFSASTLSVDYFPK